MFASLLAGCLLSAPAEGAAPAPRPLQEVLRVEAGATCLDAATLAETIRSWLGREMIDASIARIDVRGDRARADAVAITVEARGEQIERAFDPAPPSCGELHAVVGLAVAIAVDTSVLEGLGYEVVGPNEVATPQARDAERAPLSPRTRHTGGPSGPRRRPQTGVVVGLRGGAWLGVLPGIGGGGAGQIELGWLGWLDLRLAIWGGYGGRVMLDAESSMTLALVGGRVDVCAALPRKRLRPRLCFGSATGALQVGAKAPGVRSAAAPWAALVLGSELRIWTARRIALDVVVDLVTPVVRPVLAERDPSKAGMIGDSLALPPVGAVVGLGAAFSVQ